MSSQGRKSHHFHVHLVSDATGTTLLGLARACLSQFDDINPVERFWPLVRTERQLKKVMTEISECPGPVLFTMVDREMRRALLDREMRRALQKKCKELNIPCMPVMDPILKGLSAYLGTPSKGIPGLQHTMDEAYFGRIDAIDFALSYDDGQNMEGIEDSDVILVGVSRTSKTPTCIFLARRGIRAANVPFVPEVPFPEKLLKLEGPMFVGLTESPDRLVHLRRNRLRADENDIHHKNNLYLDAERVAGEIKEARRFFARRGWPVIDVTRRSIEETAAEIQLLLQRRTATKDQKELL
jgi:regulator of PEP synthase PpsR (kinase-PPPase family)